ncbi:hypothetical protein RDI58_010426 [Solanum bulbocastanum]
MFYNGNH